MLRSHKPTIECNVRKLMPNGKFELIQQHSDIQKEDNKIIMEQSFPDGTGKEVTEIPMRSFLPNFMKMISERLLYNSLYEIKQTNGSMYQIRSIYVQTAGLAGFDNKGIILGKGKAPIAKADFVLTNQILEGSETGQLNHGICNFAVTEGENSSTLKFIRTFSNNSEADIAIGECGIYADHYVGGHQFMICRDLLNEGNDYTVTAGKVLTITYQFTIDSSSFFTDNWLYLLEKGCMHDVGTQYESGVTYVDNLRPASGNNVQHYFYQPSSMNLFRSVTSGIVLGTSTEAFALTNQYYGATNDKLIPHGNSEGQLQHYIATTDGYTENGDDMMWNVKKIFTNNTANPISVTELYMRIISDSVGYADGYYARKLFPTPTPIIIDPNASMEFEVIHKITLG